MLGLHEKVIWFNDECKHALQEKQDAFRTFSENQNETNRKCYREKQRNLRKLISSNEAKVNKDLLRQLSTDKDRWKFINEQRNSARPSVSIDSRRNSFGDVLTGPMQIAELLNYKFSKLGKNLSRSRSTPPKFREIEHEQVFNCFGFHSFAVREVTDELLRLRKDKPRGPSPIPPWALIDSAHIVAPVLTLIFNKAIMQCKFPKALKLADITPVHKKGDPQDPMNYRPISVTPILSNLFEKLLFRQLSKYLNDNNVLSQTQFGFRKSRSTKDNLLYFTDCVRQNMEANKSVFCAALDLSKSFDSICHHRLQSKLVSIGFDNFSCALINDFFTDRLQRVELCGINSNWISVKQGVPQGTILGPVLFLIYVKEMRDLRITSKIVQYADDTLVFTSNVYPQMAKQELEHSLENLVRFIEYNNFQVNPKKTEFISFSKPSLAKRTELMTLDLCNKKIEPSHRIKYLGVHLDKHLKYDIQVKHSLKKMATSSKTLAQVRGSLPKERRLLLYRSLIISQLEYPILL